MSPTLGSTGFISGSPLVVGGAKAVVVVVVVVEVDVGEGVGVGVAVSKGAGEFKLTHPAVWMGVAFTSV